MLPKPARVKNGKRRQIGVHKWRVEEKEKEWFLELPRADARQLKT